MDSTMQFSAGLVLRRACSIAAQNLVPFLLTALLLFTPVFIVSLIVGPGEPGHGYHVGDAEVAEVRHSKLAGQLVVGMLAFLAQYILAGALAYGVLGHLRGRKVSVIDGVVGGLHRLLPSIDVAFVVGILVGIGFVLLVVPGVVLATVLYVAVPVALVERLGVTKALTRSRDLTRGHRGSILVLLLATLGPMVLTGLFLPDALAGTGRTLAILIAAHVQVLFALLSGVCQTVAYHDLRIMKEGDRPDPKAAFLDAT